ncbi:MAG: RNA polymerase-associated protein RapA [Gammaproteobacteria bacterium]|nr:RNA polymerase-associated protein RapA [Gammaproteobacteria bacterium]
MLDPTPGQRCISDAEPQLGLGTVTASDQRTVTVHFASSEETRTYAKSTAPLTRVIFKPGDPIRSRDGWSLIVTQIKERDGLLTYVGNREDDHSPASLEEADLDHFIQLIRPAERLFSGQVDANKWFELRYHTLLQLHRLAGSELTGLTGGRTRFIPHQLYIAHEVANRFAPRVLLADEVGLGKTIEAGLILQQQLLTEQARRVLIVVPESLLHQWLVEMLRRFNLRFSIFDEERCAALTDNPNETGVPDESGGPSEADTEFQNPFNSEQLILCTLEFLCQHENRFQQALACDWDLLVVDEAHHLQWTPQTSSHEYQCIEQLAARTQGVLLLTATPEQLGKAGHFARLRLLDPNRFPDFDAFIKEEESYEPIADAVSALLDNQALEKNKLVVLLKSIQDQISTDQHQALLKALQDPTDRNTEQARHDLIDKLLDHHGTGRVLFRNTRSAIKGFPGRTLKAYPLHLPEAYAQVLAQLQETGVIETQLLLCPELLYQADDTPSPSHWTGIDPRVSWLSDTLDGLEPDKVLVITASAASAMDIADALKARTGLHAAVFHEGMSIIERDRAAAYFADPLEGPRGGGQVLICSEIGSEGRNFQFAHHLVLFDLPLNPDLLEQRIGRLDRIGQTQTIQIHVPYLLGCAQESMYQWYHLGLNAFEQTCPTGYSVFTQTKDLLITALHKLDDDSGDFAALIDKTKQINADLNAALHRGRDRLLEYNSCRPEIATALVEQAEREDRDSDLMGYLEKVFNCYGVDTEYHSKTSIVIHPSDHMVVHSFPGLGPEGMTLTCDRDTALSNEDMQFTTWAHPLVTGAMDMVLASELGNTALVAIKCEGFAPGSLLLECIYLLETASTETLHTHRYLPPTPIRIVVDQQGDDHSGVLSPQWIEENHQRVDRETAVRIIHNTTPELRALVSAGEHLAQQQVPDILEAAQKRAKQLLVGEIERLSALGQVNPNVRNEEIDYFKSQHAALDQAIGSAQLRLEGLRVIAVT